MTNTISEQDIRGIIDSMPGSLTQERDGAKAGEELRNILSEHY